MLTAILFCLGIALGLTLLITGIVFRAALRVLGVMLMVFFGAAIAIVCGVLALTLGIFLF